jgi:hypothetical protein
MPFVNDLARWAPFHGPTLMRWVIRTQQECEGPPYDAGSYLYGAPLTFDGRETWSTAAYDSLLVAPNASHVMISYSPGACGISYRMHEAYPAKNFLRHLYDDLERQGWKPRPSTSGHDRGRAFRLTWSRINLNLTMLTRPAYAWYGEWENNEKDSVTYGLNYGIDGGEPYKVDVLVDASYFPSDHAQFRAYSPPTTGPSLTDRFSGHVYDIFSLSVFVAVPLLLVITKLPLASPTEVGTAG